MTTLDTRTSELPTFAGPARVLLVGHPNVGKSVVFNYLSGSAAAVSNYPGTTVDLETSLAPMGDNLVELVDTPGTRSLVTGSEDERVTQRCLLDTPGATVIQVGDAKNLRRTLFLTSQLGELGHPQVLVLNMLDECRETREIPDARRLEERLGCPVRLTTAITGEGMDSLQKDVARASPGKLLFRFPGPVERAIGEIESLLPDSPARRGLAVLFLSGDQEVEGRIEAGLNRSAGDARDGVLSRLRGIRAGAARQLEVPLALAIHQARYEEMNRLAAAVLRRDGEPGSPSKREARLLYSAALLPSLGLVAGWVSFYLLQRVGLSYFLGDRLWLAHTGGVLGAGLFAWRAREHHRRRLTPKESLGELAVFPSTAFPLLALTLYAAYLIVGVFAAGECVNFIENKLFANVAGGPGFDVGLYVPSSTEFTADGELMGWTFFHVPWAGLNYYLAQGARALLGGTAHPLYELFFHETMGLITVGFTYAVAIVLPIVAFFFLLFGILEDSGYLPRIAILTDRTLKRIGLNGKAVLPLILGLGCDTMATMTTRILETRKERTIAILLLALAVPCSAQIGIITGVMARVSPLSLILFVAIVLSQLLLVGYAAAKLLPGKASDFLLEVPPIRTPLIGNVWMKTSSRIRWFLIEAVPLFLLGTFILFIAEKMGLIPVLTRWGEPVVTGVLGLPAETTTGFLLGFLRRDFGAVAILQGFTDGNTIDVKQVLVAVVVITLFVPCLANFFVMVREKGMKTAAAMAAFIFPYAVIVGGSLRWALSFVDASWLAGR